MIDAKNVFDKPVKNDLRTCDNIRKISTVQGALGARLLRNLFIGKGTIRASAGTFRAGEGTTMAGQEF